MRQLFSITALLAFAAACASPVSTPRALAVETSLFAKDSEGEESVKVVLHPAPEPEPALKYQLLPKFLQRLPGNAAVDYGKVTAERKHTLGNRDWMRKNVYDRLEAPLEQLRGVELELSRTVFGDLDRAARREYCDWQVPIREESFYTILLPEAQQTRDFARVLVVRTRIEIANGRYESAVDSLQSGYALARNIGQGPTLIHGLVGISIAGMMDSCLIEMVQQPDAPNLYWALSTLPRPLIDMRKGVDAEMNMLDLSWPELRDVAEGKRTGDDARKTLQKIWKELAGWIDSRHPLEWRARPEYLAAMALKGYPAAKQALIETGMPAEEVEAMPVARVVALDTLQTYERLRDDTFKSFGLPYWQARNGLDQARRRLQAHLAKRPEIIPAVGILLPAASAARTALARKERQTALLRLLEALRIHAAAHEGRLPQKLGDLTEVPLPNDPYTGEPFRYRLEGDHALVEGPPMPGRLLRLEIRMARK